MLTTIIFSSLSLTPSSIVKRDGLLRKQNNANYSRKCHKNDQEMKLNMSLCLKKS